MIVRLDSLSAPVENFVARNIEGRNGSKHPVAFRRCARSLGREPLREALGDRLYRKRLDLVESLWAIKQRRSRFGDVSSHSPGRLRLVRPKAGSRW